MRLFFLYFFMISSFVLGQTNLSFEEAQRLMSLQKYQEAYRLYEAISQNHEFSSQRDLSLCRMGMILSIQKEHLKAANFLHMIVDSNVIDHENKDICRYTFVQVLALLKKKEEVLSFLNKYSFEYLTPLYRARIFAIGMHFSSQEERKKWEIKVRQEMDILKIKDLEVSALAIKISRNELKEDIQNNNAFLNSNDDFWNALRSHRLGNFQKKDSSHPFLNWLNQRSAFLENTKNIHVSIVLPEEERFLVFNTRILRSVSAFLKNAVQRKNTQIKVQEFFVSSDFSLTDLQLQHIYEKSHVIIGLFPSSLLQKIQGWSNLLGVPTLALGPLGFSQETLSPFLVRVGTMISPQVDELVRFYRQEGLHKKWVLMASADWYGTSLIRAVEAQMKKDEVSFHTILYTPGQLSFEKEVQEALGSQRSAEALAFRQNCLVKQDKKDKKDKKDICPSYIPFDYIFLADSMDMVRKVASTFAFYNATSLNWVGDMQWKEGLTGQGTIADPFLNGARMLSKVEGKEASFLRGHLNIPQEDISLEFQVFDSFLLVEKAFEKMEKPRGVYAIKEWKSSSFFLEGASFLGGLLPTYGEIFSRWQWVKYHQGSFVSF